MKKHLLCDCLQRNITCSQEENRIEKEWHERRNLIFRERDNKEDKDKRDDYLYPRIEPVDKGILV